MEKEINLIGEIDFKDVKVKVYNDPYTKDDIVQCVWRMRNPDTCYEGIMWMNWETGKMTYPEDEISQILCQNASEQIRKINDTNYLTTDLINFMSSLGWIEEHDSFKSNGDVHAFAFIKKKNKTK